MDAQTGAMSQEAVTNSQTMFNTATQTAEAGTELSLSEVDQCLASRLLVVSVVFDRILKRADEGLYGAKNSGCDKVVTAFWRFRCYQ